jgi:hypothetical protein
MHEKRPEYHKIWKCRIHDALRFKSIGKRFIIALGAAIFDELNAVFPCSYKHYRYETAVSPNYN